ncbi:hypothetical protein ED733_003230 [Metarhizium rileyi]|uniref:Uncharacterized protein n=1 Tax=Metarhizium rileyi (strain RCEF 4871) TaxID=1649241 RepID=A0A5C6G4S8_METRR|nr:hypothetical protein ED733_003230 [Metarhizium rileyi]
MLSAWSDTFIAHPLPAGFLHSDFDPELDLEEHLEQIRSQRDPDLTKIWLPVLEVDETKDEGLKFPPRAHRLAQLLWHQLENESIETDASQMYLHDLRQKAAEYLEGFSPTPSPMSQRLDENLAEIVTPPIVPYQKRGIPCDEESFISVVDLTSEPDDLGMCQDDLAVFAADSHTDTITQTHRFSIEPGRPIDRPDLGTRYSENLSKQDTKKTLNLSLNHTDPSSSSYRFRADSLRLNRLQEPYNSSDGTSIATSSDPSPLKQLLGQKSAEPSISKYFLHATAADNTHNAPEVPELDITLENEVGVLVDREHKQNVSESQPPVGEGAKVADHNVLKLETSKQERHPVNNSYNTNSLLSRFMEMRGMKTSRPTSPGIGNSNAMEITITDQLQIPEPASIKSKKRPEQRPATAPEVLVPSEPGCCLLSLQLGYSMIKNLEESWPADKLLDRDYDSHVYLSDHSLGDNNVAFFGSHSEVDVSFTPTVGLVATTLLQVKQKPLPGSNCLTSLRQRMLNLSRQYRTLIVLVTEGNSYGEYMTELPASDLAAYIDFVAFVYQLPADICVYLVPGADKTLSRWILAVMSRHSPQMLPFDESTSFCNTKWELFFRRSGLNVRASLILSHLLFEEFANSGLATFLGMTAKQKKSKYGAILGLEDSIRRAEEIWNAGEEI